MKLSHTPLCIGLPGALKCQPEAAVDVTTAFMSNDLEVVRAAALEGVGFAILPHFAVADALAEGRLVALVLGEGVAPTAVHAIFPGHAIVNSTARALAEAVRLELERRTERIKG